MSIEVGHYVIYAPKDGKVWISNLATGEGGSFPIEKLEVVVNEFFGKEF